MLKTIKSSAEIAIVGGALLGGVGLALWGKPQWYYNPEEEFKQKGVKLIKSNQIDAYALSHDLNEHFLTFHNIEGSSFLRQYVLKREYLHLSDDLANNLTRAAYEIHSMCLEAVERVVSDGAILELFEIPGRNEGAV